MEPRPIEPPLDMRRSKIDIDLIVNRSNLLVNFLFLSKISSKLNSILSLPKSKREALGVKRLEELEALKMEIRGMLRAKRSSVEEGLREGVYREI